MACFGARSVYHLVDDTTILWVSVALLFAPLAAVFFLSMSSTKVWYLFGILPLLAMALLLIGNGALDKSPAAQISAKVFDRNFRTRGRMSGQRYHLMVTPSWRPHREYESLAVSSDVYAKTRVNDTVSFDLHSGFFHLPWYDDVEPR
jgi:hypothetical protein